MGLDVYVGSLTRYYAEGPLDVVERVARQQGVPLSSPEDPTGRLGDEAVIRAAVLHWRDGLGRWLGDRLPEPLDWDESREAPCFTDKPGWDGYGGTLLLAAHDEHPELARPTAVSADWPDDPAYQASLAAGAESRYDQLFGPELWLPCRFHFTVRTQDVTGNPVEVGSSVALVDQLETLRARCDLTAEPAGDDPLAVAAGIGLRLLLRLAQRSAQHRVPMKLDF